MCAGPTGTKDPGSITSELLSSSAGSPRSPEPLRHPKVLHPPRASEAPRSQAGFSCGPKGSGGASWRCPAGFSLCWQRAGCTWAAGGCSCRQREALGCGSCLALHRGGRAPLSFEGQ